MTFEICLPILSLIICFFSLRGDSFDKSTGKFTLSGRIVVICTFITTAFTIYNSQKGATENQALKEKIEVLQYSLNAQTKTIEQVNETVTDTKSTLATIDSAESKIIKDTIFKIKDYASFVIPFAIGKDMKMDIKHNGKLILKHNKKEIPIAQAFNEESPYEFGEGCAKLSNESGLECEVKFKLWANKKQQKAAAAASIKCAGDILEDYKHSPSGKSIVRYYVSIGCYTSTRNLDEIRKKIDIPLNSAMKYTEKLSKDNKPLFCCLLGNENEEFDKMKKLSDQIKKTYPDCFVVALTYNDGKLIKWTDKVTAEIEL
jgi:hypothetical protein